MNAILEGLKQYFQNTDASQVLKDWAEFDEFNKIGPTIEEFMKQSSFMYKMDNNMSRWKFSSPTISQNPKFSSDFFLPKFQL